jgi:hypothetical protein
MSCPLPPGDCGTGSGDPRGASRSRRAVPGVGRLVGGVAVATATLRIGHSCATRGPRSFESRGIGVVAKVAVNLQGAEGIGARSRNARLGRSRAGAREGIRC